MDFPINLNFKWFIISNTICCEYKEKRWHVNGRNIRNLNP